MSDCAKCGACTAVCPVYRQSGRESHSARGKLHLLDVLGLARASTEFVNIFSACLLCGACAAVCSREIDVCSELVAARESFSKLSGPYGYERYLARKLLEYPGSLSTLRVLGRGGEKLIGAHLPKDSGLRLRLAFFDDYGLTLSPVQDRLPAETGEQPLTWFPGCASRYLFPATLASCRTLLTSFSRSLTIPDGLRCCGLADWAAGDMEGAQKKGCRNIEILESTEGPILVSCASCFAHLKKYPDLFAENRNWRARAEQVAARLVEFTDYLENHSEWRKVPDRGRKQKLQVYYHDPCHMRYGAEGSDRARDLLQRSEGIEILELPGGPRCCGQGGLFYVAHPAISISIRDQLVEDVLKLQPDIVTSTCSGCLMQWQQGLTVAGSGVKVLHLAQLLEMLEK